MQLLDELTEEEYWEEYVDAFKRCRDENIRCECCDVIIMECNNWQAMRLLTNPSPSEKKYIDSKA